jgi:hypothetical protein
MWVGGLDKCVFVSCGSSKLLLEGAERWCMPMVNSCAPKAHAKACVKWLRLQQHLGLRSAWLVCLNCNTGLCGSRAAAHQSNFVTRYDVGPRSADT